MKSTNYEDFFTPITTQHAFVAVYEDLRRRIITGEIARGSKLPSEKELADEYERSGPTIREALCMLQKEGFIDVSQGGNAVVCEITMDVLMKPFSYMLTMERVSSEDIMEYQRACSDEFIRWVVTRISKEQAEALITSAKKLNGKKNDVHSFLELLFDIYIGYFECASNQILNVVINSFVKETKKHVYNGIKNSGRRMTSFADSVVSVLTASAENNVDAAQAAAKEILSLVDACLHIPLASKDSEFQSIRAGTKVSQAIYEQIRDKILSGKLAVGSQLPSEREFAEMFQRSRPPVREALRMLQSDGLITTSPGRKGSVVCNSSTSVVERQLLSIMETGSISDRELVEYRRVNDPVYGRWAAQRCSEELAFALKTIVDRSRQEGLSFQEFFDCDRQLHNTIALFSGNRIAYLLTKVLMNVSYNRRLKAAERFTQESYNFYKGNAQQQHDTLVELLESHDEDSVATFMLYHVKSFKDLL